jgi:hypothetical protein
MKTRDRAAPTPLLLIQTGQRCVGALEQSVSLLGGAPSALLVVIVVMMVMIGVVSVAVVSVMGHRVADRRPADPTHNCPNPPADCGPANSARDSSGHRTGFVRKGHVSPKISAALTQRQGQGFYEKSVERMLWHAQGVSAAD